MRRFTVDDIRELLPAGHRLVGASAGKSFTAVKPVAEADADSLVWINPTRKDKQELAESTAAQVIVCDASLRLDAPALRDKLLIVVEEPKLVFAAIVAALFEPERPHGIHPTAYVDESAVIGKDVFIGPFSYVGNIVLGNGSAIYGHCSVEHARIGSGVVIQAGCVIGSAGWGFARERSSARLERFPQLGDVVIGDDVELGACACVDRGTFGSTVIERGARVGSFTLVAHNSHVGANAFVSPHVMLSGSVRVGARAWLAPGVVVRDVVTIGDDAMVGLGAVVVKDVPDGARVMGLPARDIDEYKAQLRVLRRLADGNDAAP